MFGFDIFVLALLVLFVALVIAAVFVLALGIVPDMSLNMASAASLGAG